MPRGSGEGEGSSTPAGMWAGGQLQEEFGSRVPEEIVEGGVVPHEEQAVAAVEVGGGLTGGLGIGSCCAIHIVPEVAVRATVHVAPFELVVLDQFTPFPAHELRACEVLDGQPAQDLHYHFQWKDYWFLLRHLIFRWNDGLRRRDVAFLALALFVQDYDSRTLFLLSVS